MRWRVDASAQWVSSITSNSGRSRSEGLQRGDDGGEQLGALDAVAPAPTRAAAARAPGSGPRAHRARPRRANRTPRRTAGTAARCHRGRGNGRPARGARRRGRERRARAAGGSCRCRRRRRPGPDSRVACIGHAGGVEELLELTTPADQRDRRRPVLGHASHDVGHDPRPDADIACGKSASTTFAAACSVRCHQAQRTAGANRVRPPRGERRITQCHTFAALRRRAVTGKRRVRREVRGSTPKAAVSSGEGEP